MKYIVSLLLALMMIPVAALAQSEPAATNADGKPYVLNEFQGTALDLTQYKGKAIWLNFFTGWCPYCMTEMPFIKQVFDEYSKDDIAIVLVHVWDGETADDSKTVIEKFGLQDMTMVEDQDQNLSSLVGLSGYPTSFFIDKEGYLLSGTYGLTYDDMTSYMDQLGVAKLDAAATDATATADVTAAPDAIATTTPAASAQ